MRLILSIKLYVHLQTSKKGFIANNNNLYLRIFYTTFFSFWLCINKGNDIFNLAILLLGFLIKDGGITRLQSQENSEL